MKYHWLDKQEYPFKSNYFSIGKHRLHYIDEGNGDVIIFVHGTPSWSFDFRNVIKPLKKEFRCIAIDHMGFGLSDKPKDYDYSTQSHAKTLESFILDKSLHQITLVVHDFGGPIGLDVAIRHPDRIKNIVVLNSWLWSSESDPDFIKIKRVLNSPIIPLLYKYMNFSPRFILPNAFGEHKPDKKILAHYTKPFASSGERNGTLAFAKSLLYDQQWFEELWVKRQPIAKIPTLFIWGMKDPIIKENSLVKFESGFQNSKTIKLEKAGHFPQEEEPLLVYNAIEKFIKE